jgi:hypothetical protein
MKTTFWKDAAIAGRFLVEACELMDQGRKDDARVPLLKAIAGYELLKQHVANHLAERREFFEAMLTVFGMTLGRDTVERLLDQKANPSSVRSSSSE